MRLRLVVSGRGPAELVRRTTIEGATATSRAATSWPETRSTRNWAASAPSRLELGSTLVIWEIPEEAKEVLPYPATASCSGTEEPASRAAESTPTAVTSLAQVTAVGTWLPRRSIEPAV